MQATNEACRVLVYVPSVEEAEHYRKAMASHFPGLSVATATDPHSAVRFLPHAEVLLTWRMPAELYPLGRRLRWVQALGAGVEQVLEGRARLVDACPDAGGLLVTNAHGAYAGRIREYVLGYALALLLRVPEALGAQARRQWAELVPGRLAGKTVGIAGIGRIGSEVARAMRDLGSRVLGWKRRPSPGDALSGVADVVHVGRDRLGVLLEESDILVITLPLTPETAGLIGDAELRRMRRGAYLINVGRGGIIDEVALGRALRAGALAGAVLDVFEEEPLTPSSPLWDVPNLLITPHMAGVTVPDEILPEVLDNLDRYLHGQPLRNLVDPAAGY